MQFEEILTEIREESSLEASSRPRSLVLQRVSSDEENGHVRSKSNVSNLMELYFQILSKSIFLAFFI